MAKRHAEVPQILTPRLEASLTDLHTSITSRGSTKIVFAVDESTRNQIELFASNLRPRPRVLLYDELAHLVPKRAKTFNNTAIIALSPPKFLQERRLGYFDGLIARISCRRGSKVAFLEQASGDNELWVEKDRTSREQVLDWLPSLAKPETCYWLHEALLACIYRSRPTFRELHKMASSSLWWRAHGRDRQQTRSCLAELRRLRFIGPQGGRYSCTRTGCYLFEGLVPIREFLLKARLEAKATRLDEPGLLPARVPQEDWIRRGTLEFTKRPVCEWFSAKELLMHLRSQWQVEGGEARAVRATT